MMNIEKDGNIKEMYQLTLNDEEMNTVIAGMGLIKFLVYADTESAEKFARSIAIEVKRGYITTQTIDLIIDKIEKLIKHTL